MGTFIPNTKEEQIKMLSEIGYKSIDDLFAFIPDDCIFKGELNMPKGAPELQVFRQMEEIAKKNKVYKKIFRGAGAYNHYIPSTVDAVAGKEEFLTSYTPYQAEISQGILQSIFEYQTMICELTGMDYSNASVYDGATATAEACAMCRDKKKSVILISETVNPRISETIKTYNLGTGAEIKMVPMKDGVTDLEKLDCKDAACVVIQQPNYYGIMEDVDEIAEKISEEGLKLVMNCNPVSLGICKTPGEYGADIAVGDGQPLGLGLAYGGPYLGFMATGKKMFRKLPGRIVGETVDKNGERGYVLTLQAREQHIRREKAGSNICSNQAHCALKVAVYLSTVGKKGLKDLAILCHSKAKYLQEGLSDIGLTLAYDKPYFHEFVTNCDDAEKVLDALDERGILGGLALDNKKILWCVTEMVSKEDMDELIDIVKGVK